MEMPSQNQSKDEHDLFYSKATLKKRREHHSKLTPQQLEHSPDNPLGQVLEELPEEVRIGLDIGSGEGQYSNILAQKLDRVVSIEPSEHALRISKGLYGHNKNIHWGHGFAEDILPQLRFETPVLVFSGCVLSHLENKTAESILECINYLPQGSYLAFSENWGISFSRRMWHSRSKEWWEQQLSTWEMHFRENKGEPAGVFKGLWGKKP